MTTCHEYAACSVREDISCKRTLIALMYWWRLPKIIQTQSTPRNRASDPWGTYRRVAATTGVITTSRQQMKHARNVVQSARTRQAPAPLMLVADLQDHLMVATNDLERLNTLLAGACDTLMQSFHNTTEQIHALKHAHSSASDDEQRDSAVYQSLIQQLGGAVTALQFQDMASQLIAHTNQRLRSCVDTLAREAFGDDDEDGVSVVETPPQRPNPVTQAEMDAGSIELF